MTGFRPSGPADAADVAAFLGRAVDLDPAVVVRLRVDVGRVTSYVRLPFGVLVSRTVAGGAEPADVTVRAADLLAALDRTDPSPAPVCAGDPPTAGGGIAPGGSGIGQGGLERDAVDQVGGGAEAVPWPARRDAEWRAALPPADGWLRLDAVPADVVRSLVRAGRDALRAVPAGAPASAGESLLDHESLTVSGAGRTAVVPLRVLSALSRMGFLGAGTAGPHSGDLVAVAASGGWVRLAAAYGSAYQHTVPSLGLTLR